MRLIVSPAALRTLRDMTKNERERLMAKAEAFATNPVPSQHGKWITPLVGQTGFVRIRQGNWRAICQVNRREQAVVLVRIGDRRDIYR